jgi:hypothetical protein
MDDTRSATGEVATTFIVRLTRDARGVCGVVERVATGAKQRFEGFEGIGRVIAGMVAGRPAEGGEPLTRGRDHAHDDDAT